MRTCPRCQQSKTITEFYQRRGIAGKSVYCKPCTINQTLERQRLFKEKCIAYKGGSCQRCGYNKCVAALEFHHLDPSQKDFTIAHARLTSFNQRVKDELDKCNLLCSNCHREIHAEN